MQHYDLIIRGGTIVDGSGAPPFRGDVAVRDGWIVAVGEVAGHAEREIDAAGCAVTPGFVDIHTHFDGQLLWSPRLNPSSDHGVTTVMTGNCGVGFAPCRPGDRDELVSLLEGVEDIPGAVTGEGLTWEWETFPEYLDVIDGREHDIDVVAMVPHSPLRVYVMGQRGIDREPATPADIEAMRALMREAIDAGAIGFGTSRLFQHRTSKGEMIPTYDAAEAELQAISDVMAETGKGVFQLIPALSGDFAEEFALIRRIAARSGRPVTYTHAMARNDPGAHRQALATLDAANAAGATIKAQLYPRPIGLIVGLQATVNPFCMAPSWNAIADLPLAEKVAAMRDPDLRRRLIEEVPENPNNPNFLLSRNFAATFELGDETPNYEPDRSESIQARAEAAGIDPREFVYDLLLENDGGTLLLVAMGNYHEYNLDFVHDMLPNDNVVVGLGDGGAHYGMVCDASFPTHMLTHWVRDRPGKRFSIEQAVHYLTRKPAMVVGLADRGLLSPGHRASINVIDLDRLRLLPPEIRYDLPAGGKRLHQGAEGYVATIVSGVVIAENGVPTGNHPGKLLRGAQQPRAASDTAAVAVAAE